MFCVGCKSRLPKATAIIGDQFPSAIFLRDKTELELGLKQSTLNLTLCENPKCLLVQLCEPINLDIVYRNYPYQTGTTATMKFILASVVNEVMGNLDPHIEGIILDIGGNDGTLLSLINNDNLIKVNIDAASGINQNKEITNYKYVNSYFSALKYQELVLPAPKVIFCTAVFYQLENPVEFVSEVEKLMDDDSIFCLQLSYLGSMYESNIFDNVVHEHVTYFSLLTLENLLSRVGLKVIGARIVESYGGSLRAYIVKENSKNSFSKFEFELNQIRANEERTRINTPGALIEFGLRFKEWQLEMREMLYGVIQKVGPIYAIGASTKGNMILQAIGATTDEIIAIFDNNEKKIGTLTTGTNIPIIEEKFENLDSMYLLILPYYYSSFFQDLIRDTLERGQIVKALIPLPHPKVIEIERY